MDSTSVCPVGSFKGSTETGLYCKMDLNVNENDPYKQTSAGQAKGFFYTSNTCFLCNIWHAGMTKHKGSSVYTRSPVACVNVQRLGQS